MIILPPVNQTKRITIFNLVSIIYDIKEDRSSDVHHTKSTICLKQIYNLFKTNSTTDTLEHGVKYIQS